MEHLFGDTVCSILLALKRTSYYADIQWLSSVVIMRNLVMYIMETCPTRQWCFVVGWGEGWGGGGGGEGKRS